MRKLRRAIRKHVLKKAGIWKNRRMFPNGRWFTNA